MKRTARTLMVVMVGLGFFPQAAVAQTPARSGGAELVAGAQIAGAWVERLGVYLAAVAEDARQRQIVAEYLAEQERQAELARQAAEVEAERARTVGAIPTDFARWERLHRCEQGDDWYADGYNAADPGHQRFQGGLGMSTAAWAMATRAAAGRGVSLPSSALAASPEQQMVGAQAFYDAYGWGWACRV